MTQKDEYLFYWRDKGSMWETVFYFKNGKLHREDGPAIASFDSLYKFKSLNLYKESKTPILNPHISDIKIEKNSNGETKVIDEATIVYIDPVYYLDDVEYSKKEWKALMKKKKLYEKLNKKLPSTYIKYKRSKI